jgi:tRNA-modifying protein YgfZ
MESQALDGELITDLSHFGLIKVSGSEAQTFLQGQLTNDVRQVTETESQLTALCSAKGRIIINFRLFKRDKAYYLFLPQESLEATLKRLRMYVLRADAKLEDVSEQLSRIGVAGTTAHFTDCLGFAPPTEIDGCITNEDITVLHIPGASKRYIVFSENLENLQACLNQKSVEFKAENWALLDILAGLPQIFPATAEAFIPQMVNYQAINGISFKKGCYTGQEIVARTQYLGTLKRRMYLAKIESSDLPQASDPLYISNEEQSIGKIVNAQRHPDGSFIVLAVIPISSAESEPIHWKSQDGECLQLMDLPYSLGN